MNSAGNSIAGQIEFWARVARAALDNPDLPVSFVAESLASLAEPHEQLQPFVPRSHHPRVGRDYNNKPPNPGHDLEPKTPYSS